MVKVLVSIGAIAIALGILFMIAGFVAGGSWLLLLAAQVGLPGIISGIVFIAFGHVVELLESINASLTATSEARRQAGKQSATVTTLRLDELAAPVRALRSIGDAIGGINEAQRSAIVDFIGICNGGEISASQRQQAAAWVDTTAGALQTDLDSFRQMSPGMATRFRTAMGTVANASGVMHVVGDRKTKLDAAVARLQSALPPVPNRI